MVIKALGAVIPQTGRVAPTAPRNNLRDLCPKGQTAQGTTVGLGEWWQRG